MPLSRGSVPVLSATDLTVFKAIFDRTKDWADIEEMVEFGSPDLAEAVSWLETIVGSDDPRTCKLRDLRPADRRPDPTWRTITDR